MFKKRWVRWSAAAAALTVPAVAFAATQAAGGGCLFGLFSCPL